MGNGQQRSVIVVGAGYVGSEVAKALDASFEVTLIDPQDALHHKIASLRGAVVPGWEKRIRVPLDKLLKRGKIIREEVASASNGSVTLKNGTKLNADFVVLAHGSQSSLFPCAPRAGVFDSKTIVADLKRMQGQISAANSILVVGGGPVGCELVGEIKAQYPNKTVTLVHNQSALLSNSTPPMNPVATAKLLTLLQNIGAEVKLNTRVEDLPPLASGSDSLIVGKRGYRLSDGTTIEADLCFRAYAVPSTGGNLVSAVDDRNQVIVDKYLRVQGLNNVFCVGDANNFPETKLAYSGSQQAANVVRNIKAAAHEKPLVEYPGTAKKGAQYGAMFIPVGPQKGVGALDQSVFTSFMLRNIKGKGLFSKKTFGEKNAVLPAL